MPQTVQNNNKTAQNKGFFKIAEMNNYSLYMHKNEKI